jgi:hypothetical protein
MKITGMMNVNNQLFVSTEDAVYRLYDGKLREGRKTAS